MNSLYNCAFCRHEALDCKTCRKLASKKDKDMLWYSTRTGNSKPYGTPVPKGVQTSSPKAKRKAEF